MIAVHRLNGKEFIVNSDMIRFVEATPDTIITLSDGEKVMIKESIEQVMEAVKKYKREVFNFAIK